MLNVVMLSVVAPYRPLKVPRLGKLQTKLQILDWAQNTLLELTRQLILMVRKII
jgi:hypothetical protein